jgi:hypothetical protein
MRVLTALLLLVLGCREAPAPASRSSTTTREQRCLVPCAEIEFGDRVADQIPPLDEPPTLEAKSAAWLDDGDAVVGVLLGGAARAYPLKLLAQHEVVNDVLGGRAVTIAFSPLTGAAVAIDRAATGAPAGFGNTCGLYDGDHVLYDRDTGSWWSPMMLRAVRGPRLGAELRLVPHARLTWRAWRALRPATSVLSDRTGFAELDYSTYAYDWYEADDPQLVFTLRRFDLRLPLKQPVVGIAAGGTPRAWPAKSLPPRAVHAETVGGRAVLIVRDAASDLLAAYDRTVDGRVLDFAPAPDGDDGAFRFRDSQTGSTWNILGEAVAGPFFGSTLAPAAPYRAYWFAWSAFHPASEIFCTPQPTRTASFSERTPSICVPAATDRPAAAVAEQPKGDGA